jgi:nicotinamidase-related amidase
MPANIKILQDLFLFAINPIDMERKFRMNTSLVLVDIQNDYFPGGGMELVGMTNAGANAAQLLDRFRKKGQTTVHVQHVSMQETATFFRPDTPGVEIHACVAPLPGETVVRKYFPNSFRETELLDELKQNNIEQLVICGAMSHMCIDATTRAAADLGFTCIVIHDACATRDLTFADEAIPAKQVHGSFMAALGSAYASVSSTTDYLATG